MLAHLSIVDLAIVERLELELPSGMIALTGETGAGKSILVDALGLTMGERGNASLVRAGAERAEVNAVFDLAANAPARKWLDEQGLDAEECVVRRTVTPDGRSRAFVNDRPVTIAALRELGERLVDIHGQHAHHALLRRAVHRQLVDQHARRPELLAEVGACHRRWQEVASELEEARGRSGEREQRLDLLRFQVGELDRLGLAPGEPESLGAELRRLSHATDLLGDCTGALEAIDTEEGPSALALTETARRLVTSAVEVDARLAPVAELLEEARIRLEEAASTLRAHTERVEVDPARLAEVEARLSAIHDLARKHRRREAELPALAQALREELDELEGLEGRIAALAGELEHAEGDYRATAARLGEARKAAGEALGREASANMRALGMGDGRLEVMVQHDPALAPSPRGLDQVEFLICPGPGQPLLPLVQIASGGELSRVSLAIQVIDTQDSGIPTLVFDEVDVGVGGRLGALIGRQLRRLGETRQVLCVTHLPQVASQAHHHLRVEKQADAAGLRTELRILRGDERVAEIARMLGGLAVSKRTLAHAREMLADA